MEEIQQRLGIRIPDILLPSKDTDLYKWAVIACDQFTSQPEYWEEVAGIVGDAPSTLHMTYPEIYLEERNAPGRIEAIIATMESYLCRGVLTQCAPGVMVTSRLNAQKTLMRKGIMLSVDLECYNYEKGSTSLVRATEGTIKERIPPRLRVREGAAVEVPHVMMLIDDGARSVIEPLYARVEHTQPVYDTELMLGGGRVRAWHVPQPDALEEMVYALDALLARSLEREKDAPILFAVGDGNHSLAAAKAHWENVKQTIGPEGRETHPARFALCEIVNLYDDGIRLEPIHRVLFNVETRESLAFLQEFYNAQGLRSELLDAGAKTDSGHALQYTSEKGTGILHITDPASQVAADTLQAGLDALLNAFPKARIDYIHGKDALDTLSKTPGCLGFVLPQIKKEVLFETVAKGGVLPRKAFSIGEATEKRYYMESKRIQP